MNSLKALLKDEILDLKCIENKIPKLLKHAKLEKKFLKLMAKTWSEDENSRRILAFLNIMKAVSLKSECIGLCIKLMFTAYVRNCKFVLGSNIAEITFMQHSFLELFGVHLNEAYTHAFVYIRQLALTLRKAYSSHTKEDIQAVNNWQFVYSLHLWAMFVAKYLKNHTLIKSLVHPLTQLIIGTIKLNGGERWLPLRFHCVSMLHKLAGVPVLSQSDDIPKDMPVETSGNEFRLPLVGDSLNPNDRILIPTLPILLDVFQLVNFNRRATNASRAPLDLRLLLHFSPSQRRETASMDAIISWLFDQLLECMAIQAGSVSFPEYALPLITGLKQFTSTCRVASFSRQMKALLTKTREHAEYIAKRRRCIRSLANTNEIVGSHLVYLKIYHNLLFLPNLWFQELLNIESSSTIFDSSNKLLPFWQFYIQHKQIRRTELSRLAESHKKDNIPSESKKDKTESLNKSVESESEESDSDSDASYDYDDGTTITHVSKSSKNKKQNNNKKKQNKSKNDQHSSEESDFDLEAALKEQNPDDDDDDFNNKDQFGTPDQLTDFELDESSEELSDVNEQMFDSSEEVDEPNNSDVEMEDLKLKSVNKFHNYKQVNSKNKSLKKNKQNNFKSKNEKTIKKIQKPSIKKKSKIPKSKQLK